MSRARATGEDGSVLIVTIALVASMLVIGLASFALVDRSFLRASDQRQRETALNLAEAVLYSHAFKLAQVWPGNAPSGAAMPGSCTSAAVVSACPDPRTLTSGGGEDEGVTWTSQVRDNGGPIRDAYVVEQADEAQTGTNVKTGAPYTCPSPCRWDANGDLLLWVQARAVVRGRPRNIVALFNREEFSEQIALNNTVVAGSMETTNSGNKVIVDARGSQVVVRCASSDSKCAVINAQKGQVVPPVIVHDPAAPPALSAAQLARFKALTQNSSPPTYYTSCPPSLAGRVVYIDVPATTACTDTSAAIYNTNAEPGLVIMPRGTLRLQGTQHGILYLGNEQNSTGAVLTLSAGSEVYGGVAVDGPGRLVIGQASGPRPTITYVPGAYESPVTYGTAGLVQNTWRELAPT